MQDSRSRSSTGSSGGSPRSTGSVSDVTEFKSEAEFIDAILKVLATLGNLSPLLNERLDWVKNVGIKVDGVLVTDKNWLTEAAKDGENIFTILEGKKYRHEKDTGVLRVLRTKKEEIDTRIAAEKAAELEAEQAARAQAASRDSAVDDLQLHENSGQTGATGSNSSEESAAPLGDSSSASHSASSASSSVNKTHHSALEASPAAAKKPMSSIKFGLIVAAIAAAVTLAVASAIMFPLLLPTIGPLFTSLAVVSAAAVAAVNAGVFSAIVHKVWKSFRGGAAVEQPSAAAAPTSSFNSSAVTGARNVQESILRQQRSSSVIRSDVSGSASRPAASGDTSAATGANSKVTDTSHSRQL